MPEPDTPGRWANGILRFALELGMLAGLVVGGAEVAGVWLAIAAPLAAAVAWGRFLAPKASHPVPDPGRLGLEALLFGLGAAGWAVGTAPAVGIAFAVLSALHLALTFPLGQRPAGAARV